MNFAAEKNIPLAQKVGNELVKLNPETTAAQVKTTDGSNVEAKLANIAQPQFFWANIQNKPKSTAAQIDEAVERAMGLNNSLATKADKETTETALTAKADKAALEAGLDGKVNKAGDVMSGALAIGDSVYAPQITIRRSDIELGILPSQGINYSLAYLDKNGKHFGGITGNYLQSGTIQATAFAQASHLDNGKSATIGAAVTADNIPFCFANAPRENFYANDVDTLRASVNRHPINILNPTNIYVDAVNGSDTADLFMGRGDVDKPFKSLAAAWNYATTRYRSDNANISIRLKSDVNFSGNISNTHISSLYITSADATKRKIILDNGNLLLLGGVVTFSNVIIDLQGHTLFADGHWGKSHMNITNNTEILGSDSNNNFISSLSDAFIWVFQNVTFNGVLANDSSVIYAADGGTVGFYESTLSGAVTGKRYHAMNGGRILTRGKGPNFIPGTIDGTCDATSTYS